MSHQDEKSGSGEKAGDKRRRSPSESEQQLQQPSPSGQAPTRTRTPDFLQIQNSPPRFIDIKKLMETAVGLDNMALVHEIALNPSFELKSPSKSPSDSQSNKSLGDRVHEQMNRAFFDLLKEELDQKPPYYDRALSLLKEVKGILLSLLLPHHSKLREEIDEHLDLGLLKQQCQHGCLDTRSLSTYILDFMGRLCAPCRDEEIDRLKNSLEDSNEAVVALFRGILETLDKMKLDMANFTLSAYRPVIERNSIVYEREKFDEYLRENPEGLTRTKVWLKNAFNEWNRQPTTHESPTKQPPQKAQCSSQAKDPDLVDFNSILCVAYWNLLEQQWDEDRMPETLLVDQGRLNDMRQRVLQLTITTSIILLIRNILKTLDSEFCLKLKERLFVLVEGWDGSCIQSKLESLALECSKFVEDQSQPLSPSQNESLKGQILELENRDNSLRNLICRRLRDFIVPVITNPGAATPIRVPPNLSVIQQELARLTAAFLRLVSHNRQVFSTHYQQLMQDIFAEHSLKQEKLHYFL